MANQFETSSLDAGPFETIRFERDGRVELQPEWIVVPPRGRLLVRAMCMVFDRYLRARQHAASYSKVI